MIFDHETAIIARLVDKCAPESRIVGTFDVIDFTDASVTPVACQVVLAKIDAAGQTGKSARVHLAWQVCVYVDVHRASPAEKTAAGVLLSAAAAALVGWEIEPGRELQLAEGHETGFDGRILRLSTAFTLPAFFVGT